MNKKKVEKLLDTMFMIAHECCHMHEGRTVFTPAEIKEHIKHRIKKSGIRIDPVDAACPACAVHEILEKLSRELGIEEE